MRKIFGTDGIRGPANHGAVTAETALRVAMAAGSILRRGSHRHTAVIGKDTRLSGYMLEPALTAGFISVGMDVIMLGPIPTPAVGMLTRSLRADLGVMISASHNPYSDNGIKIFGPDGFKLSDDVEAAIEARINGEMDMFLVSSAQLGHAQRLEDSNGRYIEFLKATFPRGRRLDGLKIVVDCANGAAYKAAPHVLYELGAEVIEIASAPNGFNINRDCGATAPAAMQRAVVEQGADIAIALDGDADRVILADEKGRVVDGDQVMGLIATRMAESGSLKGGGVVATQMSNLGLERHLAHHGLGLERTKVGDRYVVERMRANGYNVGGESSGHMILTDYSTTGDGLIAALQVLAAVAESGRPASEVLHVFEAVPHRLLNVPLADRAILRTPHVTAAIEAAEREIATCGRLLTRPSGTEPLVRIMAEGDDEDLIERVANDLAERIARAGQGAVDAAE